MNSANARNEVLCNGSCSVADTGLRMSRMCGREGEHAPPLSHVVPFLGVQDTGMNRQQTNGQVEVLSISSLTQNKTHKTMKPYSR